MFDFLKIVQIQLTFCLLALPITVDALIPIRACPDIYGVCKCNENKKSVSCMKLGTRTRRLPIGIPTKTKRLIVNYSSLSILGYNAFRNLRWLERVDLRYNKLDDILEYAFHSLTVLDTLLLSHNRLKFLDPDVFANLKELRVLDLSSNRLVVLTPQNFGHLDRLKKLDLQHNPIMCAAPAAFQNLHHLRWLSISNMSASLSVNLLQSSSLLTTVRFSSINSLRSIPPNFFASNLKIKELYLENLPQLGNDGIPRTLLHGLQELTVISLRACNLSRVPFDILNDVKWNLKHLDLSKNPLFRIRAKDVVFLYFLESINLKQTSLQFVESNSLHLQNIVTIDLSSNRIQTLKRNVLGAKIPKHLKNLHLGNNPWICDCHLRWLLHLNFSQDFNVPAVCKAPPSMQGVNLYQILRHRSSANRFRCHAPSITKFGISSANSSFVSITSSFTPLRFSLSCQASGYPQPEIRWLISSSKSLVNNISNVSEWFKLQKELNSRLSSCKICENCEKQRRFQFPMEINNDGSLHVRPFRPSNAVGVYVCIAENDFGKAYKSFLITTQSKDFENPAKINQHIPFDEKTNKNKSLGNAKSTFSKSLQHHFAVPNYEPHAIAPPLLQSVHPSIATNGSFCTESLLCSLNGKSHSFVTLSMNPCLLANQKEIKSERGKVTIAQSFNSSFNSKTSSFKRNELIIFYCCCILIKIFKEFFNF